MNEREFMETISALITAAAASGNQVTEEEVREAFSQMELTEEQYKMICQYLKENRISIAGVPEQKGKKADGRAEEEEQEGTDIKESPEEIRLFLEYERQIEEMDRPESEEIRRCFSPLPGGITEEARNRLTEHFLPMVLDLAREYGGRGVSRIDLAQEGSLALLQAAGLYEEGELGLFLENQVRRAMELLLEEQGGQTSIGEKLAGRANRLMEISAELASELGREATALELAERMGLTEDEIKDIMKISLDAMSVLEAAGDPAAEDFQEKEDF